MPDEIVLPEAPTAAPSAEADEFAGIEPAQKMRSPILAVLAMLMAGYLLYHLRTDLGYFLQRGPATELGDARQALGHLPPPNRHVALSGVPDRSNAAMLDTRGRDEFRQFFRLLGTDSRLLVLRSFGRIPNDRAAADHFSGRLIAFRDLSFASSIRDWFESRVVATHFFVPADLKSRAGGAEADLLDLAGDRVHLTQGSRLALDLAFPDQYRVTVPRGKIANEADARRLLEQAGFSEVAPAPLPVEMPPSGDAYLLVGRPRPEVREGVIRTITGLSPKAQVRPDPAEPAELYVSIPRSVYPDGVDQAERALANIGFDEVGPPPLVLHGHVPAARRDAAIDALQQQDGRIVVIPRVETWERTFGALGRTGSGAGGDLDLGQVARAKLIEPLVIPDDAMVLVEGDNPSGYWYVPVVYLLLVAFLGFNLYALREAIPWRSASSTR
jgi:hypothetical protein